MDASVHPTISLSLISATSLNRGEKHSDNFTIGLRPGIILILIWNVEYYKFRREKEQKKTWNARCERTREGVEKKTGEPTRHELRHKKEARVSPAN